MNRGTRASTCLALPFLGITWEPKLRYGMHRHGTKTENAMEQQHKSQDQEMEALRKQQHFTGAGSTTRNTNNTM